MQEEDLEEILEQARIGNAASGITGALIYAEGIFLQVLEGEMARLQDLMVRISKDLRHENVTVLRHGDIASAVFGDWTMAYVSATPEQVAMWAGLRAPTDISKKLADTQFDQHQAAKVTQRILSLLKPDGTGHAAAE